MPIPRSHRVLVVGLVFAALACGATATIGVTPTSLAFTYDPSSTTLPATQTLNLTSTPAGLAYTATATVNSPAGALWLTVAPGSGLSPGSLKVLVNPTGLPIGSYTGSITVAASGLTRTVAVTLTVKAPPITVTVAPASLNVSYQIGSGLPSSLPLTLTGSGSFLSYTAVAASTGGWLRVAQASGLIFAAFPATLNVAIDPTGLIPGTYKGAITVSAPQAVVPTVTVNVVLVVTPGVPVISTFWPPDLSQGAGNTTVTLNGSNFYTGSVVKANTGGPDTTLTSTYLSPTVVTAVVPASLLTAAGSLSIRVSNPAPAGDSNVLSMPILPPGPRISSIGIVSAASLQAGPISPGEIITIFGSGMGPSTLAVTSGPNVGTTLGGTQVLFGTTPAPLIYVQANQLSAIVPYDVTGATVPITVTAGAATSNVVPIAVAAAAPAFFTLDNSGTGPAASLNQDNSLNSATNAAARGSIIVLYLTGEGATNPAGVDGQIGGANALPAPVLNATVTIGGIAATVAYVGAAPGAVAGLCQLNVKVPDASPTGLAVPIQITFTGTAGNFASPAGPTVAIQ